MADPRNALPLRPDTDSQGGEQNVDTQGVTKNPLHGKELNPIGCYTHDPHARARARNAIPVTMEELAGIAAKWGIVPHDWQYDAALALSAGRDVAATVPTGSGKTLPWQLLAKAHDPAAAGLVIFLAPLIALCRDQAQRALRLGLFAAEWNSTVSPVAKREILDRFAVNDPQVLITTPESLRGSGDAAERLRNVLRGRGGLAVIDEAHTAITAKHFRTAWAEIGSVLDLLGDGYNRYLCTATCERRRQAELFRACGLRDPLIVRRAPARPNLTYKHAIRSPGELRAILDKHQGQRVIVYAATVRLATELAESFRLMGRKVGLYHGRLPSNEKDQAQQDFQDGKVKQIIATDAFGLGVDYPDIRAIVTYDPADSVSSFVQQAGRAGRDGQASTIYIASQGDPEGWKSRRFLAECSFPPLDDINAFWRFVNRGGQWVRGNPAQIATAAGVSSPAYLSTGCITWLMRKGLVETSPDEEDRRRRRFRATGSISETDWSDHQYEREDALSALEELRVLWSKPAEAIPSAIIAHFEN